MRRILTVIVIGNMMPEKAKIIIYSKHLCHKLGLEDNNIIWNIWLIWKWWAILGQDKLGYINQFQNNYQDFLGASDLKGTHVTKSRLRLNQTKSSVLETTGSENFKTVPTFDIWPSRSWDNWG